MKREESLLKLRRPSTLASISTPSLSTLAMTIFTIRSIANSKTMIGENRHLVANEAVEFEKQPVEVRDCRKITDHFFRGIYRIIYPNLIKENRRMSSCNGLDLQTLG